MGTTPRGPRHCAGTSLGLTGRRDAANSQTRMMVTAVTGLLLPATSMLDGRRMKRAAKASILSVEAFPVSGFPVERKC